MPDKSSQPPLTEEQRDAILRQTGTDAARAAASGDLAVEQGRLLMGRMGAVESRVDALESKFATLEAEREAGVPPNWPWPPERAPDHLSPPPVPPSMRPKMTTHDAAIVTVDAVDRIERDTKKQTEMIAENTSITKTTTDSIKEISTTQRKAVAAFVGMVLLYLLQNCQPSMFQAWTHKTPATTTTTAPPAMTPGANERKVP